MSIFSTVFYAPFCCETMYHGTTQHAIGSETALCQDCGLSAHDKDIPQFCFEKVLLKEFPPSTSTHFLLSSRPDDIVIIIYTHYKVQICSQSACKLLQYNYMPIIASSPGSQVPTVWLTTAPIGAPKSGLGHDSL